MRNALVVLRLYFVKANLYFLVAGPVATPAVCWR
jgi:hypothetical protein